MSTGSFGGESAQRGGVRRCLVAAATLCGALQGCAPGAAAGPEAAAAQTPRAAAGPGDQTSPPSPPNPGETQELPSWSTLDPKAADAAALERAKADCQHRTPESKAGSRESLACVWLGSARLEAGEQREALEYFRAACEAGEPLGCVGEGNVLMRGGVAVTGKGVLREPAAAEAAWKKACELGAGSGCWLLAQALGRAGDAEGAQDYRKKACDLGVVEACGGAIP
ncbi:MAG: hypothetical protein R3B89_35475 [Polyangiaceae bacterium]